MVEERRSVKFLADAQYRASGGIVEVNIGSCMYCLGNMQTRIAGHRILLVARTMTLNLRTC
jgi:hypothetical protein